MLSDYIIIMIRRWTYRCYPTPEQEEILASTFGCCRYVYNWGLQLRSDATKNGLCIGFAETSRRLTELKKETDKAWLKEVSSVCLQQSLKCLQNAFVNFYEKKSKYPKFKRRAGRNSATYTLSAFRLTEGRKRLHLAKMKDSLKIMWDRELPSDPTSCTLIRRPSGRYYITFVVNVPVVIAPKTGQMVGIDFGISNFAALSNGEKITNPKYGAKSQKRLAIEQRRLAKKIQIVDPVSGKKCDSRRRARQRRKVARIHEHIADTRKDYLNKFTTNIVREFDVICVEDLNLRDMVKNHNLARSIQDTGIGSAIRMLQEKAEAAGKTIIKIDRWFPSSKTCSVCGHVLAKLPLAIRNWTCPACQEFHDRDVNAAKNILAVGQTVSAHGDGVRTSRITAGSQLSMKCESLEYPKQVFENS